MCLFHIVRQPFYVHLDADDAEAIIVRTNTGFQNVSHLNTAIWVLEDQAKLVPSFMSASKIAPVGLTAIW